MTKHLLAVLSGRVSLWKSLRCLFHTQVDSETLFPVIVHRNSTLRFGLGCGIHVTSRGRLILGIGKNEGFHGGQHTVLDLSEGAVLQVTGQVRIADGCQISVGSRGLLEVGSGTFVNPGTKIFVRERINIGADCAISWGVTIMDTDFHGFVDQDGEELSRTKPIAIGNQVWIGAEAMILKGVKIGDGSVVAARSVVTRDVPPNTVVAGQPAQVIRTGTSWRL